MRLLPRWYATLLCAAAGLVVGSGLIGLLLAVFGLWSTPAAVAAGLLGLAGGLACGLRTVRPPAAADRRRALVGAVGALAIAATFVAWNWDRVGGSVMVERDPGVHAVAARWVERTGGLRVDADAGAFEHLGELLEHRSIGMYERSPGTLEFHSSHLAPVLFALGQGLAGLDGLFHVPVLLVGLGLLAVYALALRFTGRVWAALGVIGTLAACLPFAYVARDTHSEPVVLLLLWTGLWLWTVAADELDRWAAAAAGLAVGACLAARIDSSILLVPVPLALVALTVRRTPQRVLVAPFAAGLAPGAVAAMADLGLRSRGYVADLGTETTLSYGALVASVVLAVVVHRDRHDVVRLDDGRRARLVAGAGVGLAVLLLALWLVRPHVQTVRAGASEMVGIIQLTQGDDVDPRRRYHELSVVWQQWYLGPAVVAGAVLGVVVAARRLAASRPLSRVLLLPLAALGAGTLLYLLRPAIAPDHIWAMRRFVPAALPLLCLLAALAATAVIGRVRWRPVRGVLAVAAVAAGVGPALARTAPVADFREQGGFAAGVEAFCDVLGPDAAVVAPVGTKVGDTLTQTFRSFCGIPATTSNPGMPNSAVESLRTQLRREGRRLVVVLDGSCEPGGRLPGIVVGTSDRFLEDTLTSPPDDYTSFCLAVVVLG